MAGRTGKIKLYFNAGKSCLSLYGEDSFFAVQYQAYLFKAIYLYLLKSNDCLQWLEMTLSVNTVVFIYKIC